MPPNSRVCQVTDRSVDTSHVVRKQAGDLRVHASMNRSSRPTNECKARGLPRELVSEVRRGTGPSTCRCHFALDPPPPTPFPSYRIPSHPTAHQTAEHHTTHHTTPYTPYTPHHDAIPHGDHDDDRIDNFRDHQSLEDEHRHHNETHIDDLARRRLQYQRGHALTHYTHSRWGGVRCQESQETDAKLEAARCAEGTARVRTRLLLHRRLHHAQCHQRSIGRHADRDRPQQTISLQTTRQEGSDALHDGTDVAGMKVPGQGDNRQENSEGRTLQGTRPDPQAEGPRGQMRSWPPRNVASQMPRLGGGGSRVRDPFQCLLPWGAAL